MPERKQGELTKENAKLVLECVTEMFDGIPKSKRGNYLGHLNESCLFLERAARELPDSVA